MKAPDAETLLQVWEQSASEHLIHRALALLTAAWPELALADWARAPVGTRDACLLQLQECLFGYQLQDVSSCPECGERLESAFAVGDICAEPPALPSPPATQHLRERAWDIEYRLPNSEDLLAIRGRGLPAEDGERALLDRCVVTAKHRGQDTGIAALPQAIVDRLNEEMERLDPHAEVRMSLSCPACHHQWSSHFDIVSHLSSEIEDWAQRLLADVHTLATAYGWSERDILSLNPTRRQYYLDMVRA